LYTLAHPANGPSFDHIIIDEAQDVSELELLTLRRLSRNGSLTALGDLAQGIHAYRGIDNWEQLAAAFGGVDVHPQELLISYRHTHEAATLANRVLSSVREKREARGLGGLSPAVPSERHGEPRDVCVVDDDAALVALVAGALRRASAAGRRNVAV